MSESVAEKTVNETMDESAAEVSESVDETKPEDEQAENGKGNQETAEDSEDGDEEPVDDDDSAAMDVESTAKGSTAADDEKPFKRNGASRKRFKWLIDQGYSRNAAAQISRTPFKPKEMREKYIAETGFFKDEMAEGTWDKLSDPTKKRVKWLMKNGYSAADALKLARGTNTTKNGGPPKRSAEVSESLVVAVMATDYPTTYLTEAQTDEIKAAILNEVVQHKGAELKPHFKSSIHVNGYLRIQCKDEETRRWLQATVAKLTVPEGVCLKVATEKNHLRGGVYSGHFPDSLKDSTETILEFVESQNDNITVSEWTVLTRKEISNTGTVELVFTVDLDSAKNLQKVEHELNYKFNTIRLRRKNQPALSSGNGPNPKQRRNFNQPPNSFAPKWNNSGPRNRVGNNYNQFGGGRGGNFNRGFNDNRRGGMPPNGNRSFDFVDSLFDSLNQITGVGGGRPQWGGNSGYNPNGPRRNFNGPQNNRNFFTRSAFY